MIRMFEMEGYYVVCWKLYKGIGRLFVVLWMNEVLVYSGSVEFGGRENIDFVNELKMFFLIGLFSLGIL